ncbi:MAG: glycosyltransferase, partial [Acidimicrobiales bacterium]
MDDPHGGSLGTAIPDDLRILVDCRWLGCSGIGRSTELFLRALRSSPPPGRWILWGDCAHLGWRGAEVRPHRRDPRAVLGQLGALERPAHDVALYLPQIRPAGRRPSVQVLHDVTPIEDERRRGRRLLLRTYFRRLARATEVLACSPAAASDLRRVLDVPAGRRRVFTYPVDRDLQRRVEALRAGHRAERKVLFIGRVAPHKNLGRLIQAHSSSEWSRSGGQLVLAGPGTEALDDAVRGVSGLGAVSQPDLDLLLATSLALVLPSLREGFGLPVLEGRAAGLPVLASARAPISDHLEAGYDRSFDPLNVLAIA